MTNFGFMIIQTLVTDIEPDQRVRAAMNEINAASRLRYVHSVALLMQTLLSGCFLGPRNVVLLVETVQLTLGLNQPVFFPWTHDCMIFYCALQ